MKSFVAKIQIGKNNLTPKVAETINSALKNHKQVRISVLKSCTRNREEIKKLAEKITESLTKKCSCRIIGFTIVLTKLKHKI